MRVDLRVKRDIEARRAAIGHFERGHGPKSCERTREQELEERCRRLETEVAYLKNCVPWSRGTGSGGQDLLL